MTTISDSTSQNKGTLIGKSNYSHLGLTTDEQIVKNQAAIALIRSWQEEKLTEDELQQAQETWNKVKEIIDENRSYPLF